MPYRYPPEFRRRVLDLLAAVPYVPLPPLAFQPAKARVWFPDVHRGSRPNRADPRTSFLFSVQEGLAVLAITERAKGAVTLYRHSPL